MSYHNLPSMQICLEDIDTLSCEGFSQEDQHSVNLNGTSCREHFFLKSAGSYTGLLSHKIHAENPKDKEPKL